MGTAGTVKGRVRGRRGPLRGRADAGRRRLEGGCLTGRAGDGEGQRSALPSAARWILVVRPSRERPSA